MSEASRLAAPSGLPFPSLKNSSQLGARMKATQRSHRGFSRKVQAMVKQLEREGGEGRYTGGARGGRREKQLEREGGEGRYTGGARGGRREKQLEREGGEGRCTGEARGGRRENQEPKNWRQVSERELTRQGPVCRSRYQAYEPVPKAILEKQQESLKRIRESKTKQRMTQQEGLSLSELVELERNSELVGQLKAAEARHRVKDLRDRYERDKCKELRQLIDSQPTSIEAVRLKTFLQPQSSSGSQSTDHTLTDTLDRTQRKRCEVLIEDDKGLTINRIQ